MTSQLRSEYWIFKSEPSEYSIEHLQRDSSTLWTGVRNYQARNYLRAMQLGDKIFFYHSSCQTPGIVGLAEIDMTAQKEMTDDKGDWSCVGVRFLKAYEPGLALTELRKIESLQQCPLLRRGNRLSIIPLQQHEASTLLQFLER